MKYASMLRGPKPYQPNTPLAAKLAGAMASGMGMPAQMAEPPTTNEGSRAPAGAWTPPPQNQPTAIQQEEKPVGGPADFTIGDIMGLQHAANQSRWGNNGVGAPNIMDAFEQADDGMYRMRGQNGVPTGLPRDVTGTFRNAPWQDTGIGKDQYLQYLQSQLRNVDNSP